MITSSCTGSNDRGSQEKSDVITVEAEQPQSQRRHIRPKVRNRRNRSGITTTTTTAPKTTVKNVVGDGDGDGSASGSKVDVDVDVDALMEETLKKMASASFTSSMPISSSSLPLSKDLTTATSYVTTSIPTNSNQANEKKPKGILKHWNAKTANNTNSKKASTSTSSSSSSSKTKMMQSQSNSNTIRSSQGTTNMQQNKKDMMSLAEELGFPKGYGDPSGVGAGFSADGSKATVKPFVKDLVMERPISSLHVSQSQSRGTHSNVHHDPSNVEGYASSTYTMPQSMPMSQLASSPSPSGPSMKLSGAPPPQTKVQIQNDTTNGNADSSSNHNDERGEAEAEEDEAEEAEAAPKIIKSVEELVSYAEEVKAKAKAKTRSTSVLSIDATSETNTAHESKKNENQTDSSIDGIHKTASATSTRNANANTNHANHTNANINHANPTIEANMEFSCMSPDEYDAMGIPMDEYLQLQLSQQQNQDEGGTGTGTGSGTGIDTSIDTSNDNEDDDQDTDNGVDTDEIPDDDDDDDDDDDFLEFFGGGIMGDDEDDEEFIPPPPLRPFMVLWNAISMWITPDAVTILRQYKKEMFVDEKGNIIRSAVVKLKSTSAFTVGVDDCGDDKHDEDEDGGAHSYGANEDAVANTAAEGDTVNDIQASRCAGLMTMLKRNIPKSLHDLGYNADDGYTRRTAESRLGEFIQCFDYSEPMVKLKSDMWRALTVVLLDIILPKYDLAYEGRHHRHQDIHIHDHNRDSNNHRDVPEEEDEDGIDDESEQENAVMYPTVLKTVGIMKEEYIYLVTRAIPTLEMGSGTT